MALFDVVIDVSDAQPAIDWAKVAAAGVRLAMIKASEGATFKARHFEAHNAAARAAGIRVVPYHFMTDADPGHQAANFEGACGLVAGMPFALDWEKRHLRDGADITAGAAQVEAVGKLLTAMTGRSPLGYWGTHHHAPGAPTALMNSWERWVPRFPHGKVASFEDVQPGHRDPGVPFVFWQYTDGGMIDGIQGDVDRSVASFESIERLAAWHAGTAAATV
jgi:lysozyme